MNADVFISYPSENKLIADAICAKLESNSIRCWIAPRDILPGNQYASSLCDAIDGCRVFVLVFSDFTNYSPHILSEVQRAFNKSKIIIPFRIEDIEPLNGLEFFIANTHWMDAITPPIEYKLEELVMVVQNNLHITPDIKMNIRKTEKGFHNNLKFFPNQLSRKIIFVLAILAIILSASMIIFNSGTIKNDISTNESVQSDDFFSNVQPMDQDTSRAFDYMYKSQHLQMAGDYQGALDAINKAIEISPKDAPQYFWLYKVDILTKLGRDNEAHELMNQYRNAEF